MNHDFTNHYEVLEVSANASFETIERVFRYLAKRYHPDSNHTNDPEKFKSVVEAYQVLSDAESRASFDVSLEKSRLAEKAIEEGAGSVDNDTADRHRLLSLFYAQRRRDMKYPGIGISTVEQMMNIPTEVLDFHIWYFREKGWIMREEGGTISITADGVDHLENSSAKQMEKRLKRITDQSNRISEEIPVAV